MHGTAGSPRDDAALAAAHGAPAPGDSAPQSPHPTRDPVPEPRPGGLPDPDGVSADDAERAPADEPAAAATSSHIDVEALRRAWPDVLGRIYQMRRATWTFLSEHAQVLSYDGQRLVLGIATTGLANAFRNGSHAEVVRQALIDALGVDARVEGVPHQQSGQPPAGGGAQATYSPPQQSAPTPAADGAGQPAGPDAPRARAAAANDMGAPSPTAGPSGADWGSAPASASSAPSWATAGPASGPEQGSGPPSPTAPEPQAPREPDDASVSDDDEDIVDAGAAGPAVIERILGGTVIREE